MQLIDMMEAELARTVLACALADDLTYGPTGHQCQGVISTKAYPRENPRTVPPASKPRVTTVASVFGTQFEKTFVPNSHGTPARQMLSWRKAVIGA